MSRSRSAMLLSLLLLPSGWAGAAGVAARVAGGGVVGFAAGSAATLGTVVARARFQNHYMESTNELVGWQGALVPVGAIAGGAAGSAGAAVLGGVALGTVAGGVAGVAAGAVLGAALSSDGADTWAGGIVGGAAGMVVGFLVGWVLARRGGSRGPREGSRGVRLRPAGAVLAASAFLGLAVVGVALATGGGAEGVGGAPDVSPVPAEPGPAEEVVILVGDPGEGRYRRYPVFPRVAAEVEAWALEIGRDSAVAVVILGDIVYPTGMRRPGTSDHPRDSARVADQVAMIGKPGAREHEARMYFVAGNHDWGLREDREGARRLRNLGAFLDRVGARGANVELVPAAGTGGPHVADMGDRLRLILLDTAWWLFDAEPGGKQAVIDGVADAIAGAGDRHVVIAAHHPFQSAGPHGGFAPMGETLGLQYLLNRSGSILQDLTSRPYRDLLRGLGDVFTEAGRPLVFVGGHEHSLQVVAHAAAIAPHYSVVSGSASKLTAVSPIEGSLYEASLPGYVQLVVREDGAVDVEVVGAAAEYQACPEDEPDQLEWERCMAEGEESFETLFSARLAGPSPP